MIGSTWNKWDLHIHSPLTHHNNLYKGISIDDFVNKLIVSELSLVGITNYFYFENNELEQIRQSVSKQGSNITVLSNIEFRIHQPNKDGEWINIHCIFAEHLTTSKINDILSKLQLTNTTADGHNIYCSNSSISSSGVKIHDVTVDFKLLLDHLSSNLKFGTDYLIAVCPNGYGGYRPNMSQGRSVAVANEIEKHGQIILGRPQDREYFLSDRYMGSLPKPVFVCSDAHCLDGYGEGEDRSPGIGEKYSWVKSKPTFEGLRQAIIEAGKRVQQVDDFTERTYLKPMFQSIEISGTIFEGQEIKFKEQKILLNPNMVAIIGGRGTGKSLFLDAMCSRFNHNINSTHARKVDVEKLEVVLNQGNGSEITFDSEENSYSYLHVSQGDVQKFSQSPINLSNEIKRMLGIYNEEFNPITLNEISDIIGRYRNFVIGFWEVMDDKGNRINTGVYQNEIINKNTQLIGTLTSPQNKELIKTYQENVKNINERNTFLTQLKSLTSLMDRNLIEINESISIVNESPYSRNKLPLIGNNITVNSIKDNETLISQELLNFNANNAGIITAFQQQGINQDISSLLSKVTEYQQSIDTANFKLQEINTRTSQYYEYIQRRSELSLEYGTYLKEQKNNIDIAFQNLKEEKAHWNSEQNELVQEILQDIKIQGHIYFDINKFYNGLEACINRGKFRNTTDKTTLQRLIETFCVQTTEDFFKLLSGEEIINIDGEQKNIEAFFWLPEYYNQGGRFELFEYLFSPSRIKQYLYVNAEFEYKGKTVEKLSVGQRGTFYVSLKLATDPFGSPFVFDQPEDDLDNEFIMKQLVPLFSKIKKYRQVIIVTHNANLVVNTDVEQVIVASNEGEVISYFSGAIEDGNVIEEKGIKSSICNILEGGSIAFEKREKKYGIQALA